MKRILCCSALSWLVVFPASVRPEQEAEQEHELDTELAAHMEKIEDAAKLLRKHLKEAATFPAALEALLEIQRQTLSCKVLVPAAAAELPESERAAFVKAFRRTMVDFQMRQLELEAALLEGDPEAAKEAFDRFHDMEDTSHERFAPEDE
jgi:hypothetical protein